MEKQALLRRYHEIMQSKDLQLAWEYMDFDFSEFTAEEKLNMDMAIFKEDWHCLHDHIASDFQRDKNPAVAPFLFESVRSGKIPEFEYKPVSRRCTWALADIGTTEAKSYLEKIAESEDALVAGFAQRRLDNWANEAGRKGNSKR